MEWIFAAAAATCSEKETWDSDCFSSIKPLFKIHPSACCECDPVTIWWSLLQLWAHVRMNNFSCRCQAPYTLFYSSAYQIYQRTLAPADKTTADFIFGFGGNQQTFLLPYTFSGCMPMTSHTSGSLRNYNLHVYFCLTCVIYSSKAWA